MKRIGVFGGTFDPVHAGHIGIASAARQALGLARVDLIASFAPPHRPAHRPAPPWQRYAMVVLATAGVEGLFASDREIRRGGPSYTLDTLRSYAQDEPDAAPVLILGLDAFADLPSWKEPRALTSEFDLAVASRPGVEREDVIGSLPVWLTSRIVTPAAFPSGKGGEPAPGRVVLLDLGAYPISGTQVRRRSARGESIKDLVPEAVADYILKYGVYEGGCPATGE